ncbi:MAG TPA: hypothetical protein DHD79_01685 [Firmicutes bacterium]|nr:hypothetical protein [Bacillota bacterium]HAZ21213.1 hypothetical protein [Bacillota bacterium]HBE07347.1 hypothetical protein [Bacillota bacterium]HBG43042.1 hypothetical protein [Bacillota bacterium]HBL49145.1 hypothetical protein [Bacillota bacterium]
MYSAIFGKDRQKNSDPLESLSPRESEILQYVASGLGNAEIGKTLFISEKTVKNYVTSIRKKLGLANRAQIALYALQRGVLDLSQIKLTDQ